MHQIGENLADLDSELRLEGEILHPSSKGVEQVGQVNDVSLEFLLSVVSLPVEEAKHRFDYLGQEGELGARPWFIPLKSVQLF
jgi:hypothetical protein